MHHLNSEHYIVEEKPWGSLTWFACAALGNAEGVTVGKCVIAAGCENQVHFHPNCEEVLHVLKGRICHSYNDQSVIMEAGDTISIPAGVHHNAKNLTDEEAQMLISFSSAHRLSETVE